jgi:hypothetical protein
MIRTSIVFACLLLAAGNGAQAAFTYSDSGTVGDEFNGSIKIDRNGVADREAGTQVANAHLVNFHPRGAQAVVDGTLTRNYERDGELVTVTFAGNLTVTVAAGNNGNGNGNGEGRQATIAFTDLTIERGEEGKTVSGQLIINGESVDASHSPREIRALLLGLARLISL